MTAHSPAASHGASARTLLLAEPSPRLLALGRWLTLLGGESGPRVARIDDFGELLDERWRQVGDLLLFVDAGTLAREDVGLLRRWLAREAAATLCWVGEDGERAAAKRLLPGRGADGDGDAWLAWPPAVPSLEALLEPARGSARASAPRAPVAPPPPATAPPAAPARTDVVAHESAADDELREIEFILARPAERSAKPLAAAPAGARPRPAPAPADRPGAAVETPPWFREQIADLADVAQRIELSLSAARSADFEDSLREGTMDAPERKLSARLDELEGEVLRFLQFTRTLGFLAAAPARGGQRFDLDTLVVEWVQAQAAHYAGAREGDAPRFLVRADEGLPVVSDKGLLAQAFDAFFFLARRATPAGEAIRVSARRGAADPGRAEVTIEFPRGLLGALSCAEIVRPYALRRALPDLGPNALAAACSIVAGQGGSAHLAEGSDGRLEWRVALPLAGPGA